MNAHKDYAQLARNIKSWAQDAGFDACGISDVQLGEHERWLQQWLQAGFHGEMTYMQRHGSKRYRPQELVAGTQRIISVRLRYLPPEATDAKQVLKTDGLAYISRYALGRDYHKVLRQRLRRLARHITEQVDECGMRVFVDSAPVLEKALAQQAGLGWIGKHSNLLNRDDGSWFFLGELFTNLPLPVDQAATNHCGQCTACIDCCPTRAIVAPYQVDARRCISYHTIELAGSIPEEFRHAMGNRIYGCDDCQLVCPWNRFAQTSPLPDFAVRMQLDAPNLITLFAWNEADFLRYTEGSAIRRIGHERWLRNIAVALGNARSSTDVTQALVAKLQHPSALVREHVQWALAQHQKLPTKQPANNQNQPAAAPITYIPLQ